MSKRIEEEWNAENEKFMKELSNQCSEQSQRHAEAGYVFKQKNTTWGLPMVLLPVIMSPVSLLIQDEEASVYINALAFLATGVVGGVYSFFKYGEKMTNHFNYSGRYADIVSDIELELKRGPEFRTTWDVFSTKIHMRMDNLASTEPVLPKNISNKSYKKIQTDVANILV